MAMTWKFSFGHPFRGVIIRSNRKVIANVREECEGTSTGYEMVGHPSMWMLKI